MANYTFYKLSLRFNIVFQHNNYLFIRFVICFSYANGRSVFITQFLLVGGSILFVQNSVKSIRSTRETLAAVRNSHFNNNTSMSAAANAIVGKWKLESNENTPAFMVAMGKYYNTFI